MTRSRLAACLLALALPAAGCGAGPNAGAPGLQPAADLGPAVIREYQGKKLTDFERLRDNSISGPVAVDTLRYRLTVDGLVRRKLSLTYRQALGFPQYQKLITLYCVEGWDATGLWRGLLVADLLDSAGVKPAANTLIFHAADGEYTTSLPLQTVLQRRMLLCHRINNAPLSAKTGFPFMLAAEDRLGYKWIKWVDRIEVSADSTYLGFWEKRGYDNKADR
ncbi:MAG TPA: molybdopterin-dependent oxidoreductase [Candidatus Edwardsbacteria bacterium]|nr:molybdopterin-dependent oxidoreductase [Candidatus Edwardsbacteria bacterium]